MRYLTTICRTPWTIGHNQGFKKYRQMLFVAGPRQVGKTTVARHLKGLMQPYHYYNWDNVQHRELITAGPDFVAAAARIGEGEKPFIAFDEIHCQATSEIDPFPTRKLTPLLVIH
ncbi:MAG: AAA family ATPase [Parachlamydiales bacterium]